MTNLTFLQGLSRYLKLQKVVNRNPVVYRIVDLNNEEIVGTFYEQELIRTKPPSPTDLYVLDKILKHRTLKNGVKEVLVSYLGYPASFNAWIKASSIVNQSKPIKRRRKWKRHY